MFYEDLCQDSPQDFKRATGVSPALFAEMLLTLEQAKSRMGRPAKLNLSNQLLLTLMYLREYRTQFHIGKTYRVSEPTVCRIVTRVENTLMASGQYTLPGKHVLSETEVSHELILVDATETPCERPKKTEVGVTAAKRSATRLKRKSLRTTRAEKSYVCIRRTAQYTTSNYSSKRFTNSTLRRYVLQIQAIKG